MTPYGMLDLHEMHSFHSIAPRGYHRHAAAADIVDDKKKQRSYAGNAILIVEYSSKT